MSVTPLTITGSLTVDESAAVLRAAKAAMDAGCRHIDVSGLEVVDSSAVATLLASRRYALQNGFDITFSPLPQALTGLVGLYEVVGLLSRSGA